MHPTASRKPKGLWLSQNAILMAQAFEGREVHTVADLLRSNNPVLKEKVFAGELATGEAMTIQGTVNKTGLLLLFVVVAAAWTWGLVHSEAPQAAYPWVFGGMLGGFVVGLITSFKANWAPFLSPIYALMEGLFLGGISAVLDKRYPGVAIQAV